MGERADGGSAAAQESSEPALFPTRLLDGYRAFRADRYGAEHARYRRLATEGQRPSIMLIGCCDSRAAPELIFDAGPGEIFVARNIANLVPPYQPNGDFHGTSAALEFAVIALGVRDVVVMGHGRCGGIHAALAGPEALSPGDFIGNWMAMIEDVAAAVRSDPELGEAERQRALEHRAVGRSLANLMSFPWIAARVHAGRLVLHGAWFDIAEGRLHVLDRATGRFDPVGGDPAPELERPDPAEAAG